MRYSPQQMVRLLTALLEFLTEVLRQWDGTV